MTVDNLPDRRPPTEDPVFSLRRSALFWEDNEQPYIAIQLKILSYRARAHREEDLGRFAVILGALVQTDTFTTLEEAFAYAQHHRPGKLALIHKFEETGLEPDEIWSVGRIQDPTLELRRSRYHRNQVLTTVRRKQVDVERQLLHPDARNFFASEPASS